MTDDVHPNPTNPAPKRRGGRPPGAKTNPAIKAATKARKESGAAGTVPRDDLAAQIAAAAIPADKPAAAGGRPTVGATARTTLAQSLAAAYEGFGGLLSTAGAVATAVNPALGGRLLDVGRELIANADRCGIALARWADTNPRVKAWLNNMATGSGALMVLAAHAPIIAAAAGHADKSALAGTVADMAAGVPNPMVDMMAAFSTMFTNVESPVVENPAAA